MSRWDVSAGVEIWCPASPVFRTVSGQVRDVRG
jgi:hypothetical protein